MCSYNCPTLKGHQVLQLVFELIVFILYLLSQNFLVLCKDLDLLQWLTHLQDKQKLNSAGATDLPILSSWWSLVPVAVWPWLTYLGHLCRVLWALGVQVQRHPAQKASCTLEGSPQQTQLSPFRGVRSKPLFATPWRDLLQLFLQQRWVR